MMHSKVYFINSSLQGHVHEVIDTSMLAIFATIYSNVEVHLLDGRMQVISEELEKVVNKEQFEHVRFLKTHLFSKMTVTIGALFDAWFYIRSEKNSLCYFTSVNYLSVHIINFLSKILHKDVIICSHSELSLIESPNVHFSQRWAYLVQRFFVKTSISKYVNIMVLSNHILDNVKRCMPERSKYYFAFEHPYFTFCQSDQKMKDFNSEHIKIGVIGTVTESFERGFNNIRDFAMMIDSESNIEFSVIGRIPKKLVKLLPSKVKIYNDNGRFIPKDEYDNLVEELDFIYLPYPNGSFKYTASGAVLEALFKNKGIIMHQNNYSLYLTGKYGDFGYFIDNLPKKKVLENITSKDFYEQLIKNGETVRKKLTPNSVLNYFGIDYFKEQCERRK